MNDELVGLGLGQVVVVYFRVLPMNFLGVFEENCENSQDCR